MKMMKHPALILLAAAAALVLGACERQPYSETRPFTHHGEHGSDDAGKAGEHKPHEGEAKPAGAEAKPEGEQKPVGQ
jgi:hypothetical protein